MISKHLTMSSMKAYMFLLISGLSAAASVDLQAKYPFSSVLLDQGGQYYALYWNFTRTTESIYFAVNVSTTGWVGFGLSPNGQMPGSDVVIGWVSNGQGFLWDRYAEDRVLPVIDAVSQDWFLTNSEEANGYTVLEFSRNFTSCDPQDLDITTNTARVIWSFNIDDSDPTDPMGSDAVQHDFQGSQSLNLIGGQPGRNVALLGDELFLEITVPNVTIPSASTIYWCASYGLPSSLINTTHFINRMAPVIQQHARSFVHHILVYLCPSPLSSEDVGASAPCREVNPAVRGCRAGPLIGAWAVGGEDFVYPEGVTYPVGGLGQEHFIVLEMHYDNPDMTEGVVDSSGMLLYYNTEEPDQRAGILLLGHAVNEAMFIPPRTQNFTIAGICSADCTNRFIPEEGIRVFANGLHTHVIGRGLTIQHYRRNPDCDVLEELEPIDQNLNYDFNFQQISYLPREHLVLPGDTLVLTCNYSSMENSRVTFGGESTLEEMCLSFLLYYPRPADGSILSQCLSTPTSSSFTDFFLFLQRTNPEAAQRFTDPDQTAAVLNELDWGGDPTLATTLQDSVLQSQRVGFCRPEIGERVQPSVSAPGVNCSFLRPDKCTSSPPTCCKRIMSSGDPHTTNTMATALFTLLLSSVNINIIL